MTYKFPDGTIAKYTEIDEVVANAKKYETKYRNSES
jgi:hypothetical protein